MESPSRPDLDRVCSRIYEISTLPQVAARVMEVASDAKSGALELKEAMEIDAALSSRVLRCVNSSAYATSERITSLQHAVTFLGFKEVRNLAMTASVSKLFTGDVSIGTYQRGALWRHLVSVGICGRLIAQRLSNVEPEEAFLAGLLHDIGIVLEDQYLNDYFVQIMESLADDSNLNDVETEIIGFNHARLGGKLAEAWRFPRPAADAILYHHDSTRHKGGSERIVQCVEVANYACSVKGITSVGRNLVRFPQNAIEGLSLTRADFVTLVQGLDAELNEKQELFNL